jgi:hypothetical protein
MPFPVTKYPQEIEIEAVLGNPVIADMVDRNYYSGPRAIARGMCELNATYPSIRQVRPDLFFLSEELSSTSFWWTATGVHLICILYINDDVHLLLYVRSGL